MDCILSEHDIILKYVLKWVFESIITGFPLMPLPHTAWEIVPSENKAGDKVEVLYLYTDGKCLQPNWRSPTEFFLQQSFVFLKVPASKIRFSLCLPKLMKDKHVEGINKFLSPLGRSQEVRVPLLADCTLQAGWYRFLYCSQKPGHGSLLGEEQIVLISCSLLSHNMTLEYVVNTCWYAKTTKDMSFPFKKKERLPKSIIWFVKTSVIIHAHQEIFKKTGEATCLLQHSAHGIVSMLVTTGKDASDNYENYYLEPTRGRASNEDFKKVSVPMKVTFFQK